MFKKTLQKPIYTIGYRFHTVSRNIACYLCPKFYLKHTLQVFDGCLQVKADRLRVTQFVTLRLEQGTKSGRLPCACHPAAPLIVCPMRRTSAASPLAIAGPSASIRL